MAWDAALPMAPNHQNGPEMACNAINCTQCSEPRPECARHTHSKLHLHYQSIIKLLSRRHPVLPSNCTGGTGAALGRHWGGTQRTETALNDTKPFKIALDYQKQSNIAVRYCSEIALKLL